MVREHENLHFGKTQCKIPDKQHANCDLGRRAANYLSKVECVRAKDNRLSRHRPKGQYRFHKLSNGFSNPGTGLIFSITSDWLWRLRGGCFPIGQSRRLPVGFGIVWRCGFQTEALSGSFG
jgi:hypothetical protein